MPDDVIKETNRQIVFYPRIHKKKGWQSWFAEEAMDGGGVCEYTRDPALLSPNDPHQSTSTASNKQQQRRKTD